MLQFCIVSFFLTLISATAFWSFQVLFFLISPLLSFSFPQTLKTVACLPTKRPIHLDGLVVELLFHPIRPFQPWHCFPSVTPLSRQTRRQVHPDRVVIYRYYCHFYCLLSFCLRPLQSPFSNELCVCMCMSFLQRKKEVPGPK
ncbi:hypothetical protein BDB00DRAFT_817406 [Zychaea mexicana]|uniref:uncharacterized protein n=1 Tax=Zychaea mexicana TaxID=64656 RepID=UPI0022FE5926|nr:uncharacterized protein BDB00DRAFT_817406 [Zychaea mexicana]KAI9494584.1 hypothetical protein BDB00DRAFT_817406 [Zychaea mexicana]